MNFVLDEREIFVPYYDLNGEPLPYDEQEKLRAALANSDAQSKEEILLFVDNWLRETSVADNVVA
jgi:hypothetical protein